MNNENNISINKSHYDKVYSKFEIESLVKKLKKPRQVLQRSRRNILSMDAFYNQGFEDRINNKYILEIGAGNGLNAFIMTSFGALVDTQDISPSSAEIIEKLNHELNLGIVPHSGNLTNLPFENNQFDFIVGKSIIHHLTHEIEEKYLFKIAKILKQEGEVRFVEPAHNRPILRKILLMIPTKNRPSSLNFKEYHKYKMTDPHPIRDNSTKHFTKLGKRYFDYVNIVPFGMESSLIGLFPRFLMNRGIKLIIKRIVSSFPSWFSFKLAKVQIITYRFPKNSIEDSAPK